jgi:hypothetical protein
MKQTAVDFAVEQLEKLIPSGNQILIGIILGKAKEMEKEEMKEFYQDGFFIPFPSDATFEQIYKEKYETDSNTTSHCNGEK